MNQVAFDFSAARAAANRGMRQALDHAEYTDQEWPDLAYAFLCRYARSHEFFEGWHVTEAARLCGYDAPTTGRAWGSLYVKAQKDGVMVKAGAGRNPHRHNSICERYRSLVFSGVHA